MPETRAARMLRPLVDLAGRSPLRGGVLLATTAGLLGVTVGIGLAEAATGAELAFGILYLIPVAVAAAIAGTWVGVAVGGFSAIVWVAAERSITDRDPAVAMDVLNVGLRFLTLGFIVALIAAIRGSLLAARRSDQRSRDFLAYAAHQLRTPTASVSVTAQSLLAQGHGSEVEHSLVRLVAESDRVGRLVTSILRFVRLDQSAPLPQVRVDLVALAGGEVQRQADGQPPAGVDVRMDAGPPVVAMASPGALEEALGNVIDNACRHARTSVRVRVRVVGRCGEIVVRDDGPGLPPGAEDRAFEPFVTLDGHAGTGLGLSIARRLLEAHGGTLEYRSGDFVLAVPLAS